MSMSSSKSTNSCGAGGCGSSEPFDGATPEYRRALGWVIVINIVGFLVVLGGGVLQGSASLASNALDFLADSATYAISLWAIGKSVSIRTGAAFFKSVSLALVGVSVLAFALWRAWAGETPVGEAITGLGLFGAAANLMAAVLLAKYRDGDANVRSVWLCTRNDLIQCLAVAATGVAVWLTGSVWPDIIVGVFLAALFLRSAFSILQQARAERATERRSH